MIVKWMYLLLPILLSLFNASFSGPFCSLKLLLNSCPLAYFPRPAIHHYLVFPAVKPPGYVSVFGTLKMATQGVWVKNNKVLAMRY